MKLATFSFSRRRRIVIVDVAMRLKSGDRVRVEFHGIGANETLCEAESGGISIV